MISISLLYYCCFNVFLLFVFADELITIDSPVGQIRGRNHIITFGMPDQKTTTKIAMFLGIPYAEPPVGRQRFMKPVPKAKFKTTFSALEFGSSCPQNHPFFKPIKTDEDCLFLNIYTPSTTGKVAVMIWIHGGGFIIGDGRVFGGGRLAAYSNVVVVTINYRLGPLGFLNTQDDHVDPNNGLHDQQLAIKWVHDNIMSFGGDPSEVTIFGESAGSVSVIHQSLYPENKGLFQRVIAESGSANIPSAMTPDPIAKAKEYARYFHCPVNSMAEMVKCLRELDASTMTIELDQWIPSYDNDFVVKARVAALETADGDTELPVFKKIDLLMGTNRYEGQMFLLTPEYNEFYSEWKNTSNCETMKDINDKIYKKKLKEMFGMENHENIEDAVSFQYTNYEEPLNKDRHIHEASDLFTDIDFFIPTHRTLEKHAYNNNVSKTYQYEFNELLPFLPHDTWVKGALHSDELPYVFGFPEAMQPYYGYNQTLADTQWSLSLKIMEYFSNFAKTGDPNSPGLVQWKEYTSRNRDYIYLTSDTIVNKNHLNPRRTKFWTSYIPILRSRRLIKTSTRAPGDQACSSSAAELMAVLYLYSLVLFIINH